MVFWEKAEMENRKRLKDKRIEEWKDLKVMGIADNDEIWAFRI